MKGFMIIFGIYEYRREASNLFLQSQKSAKEKIESLEKQIQIKGIKLDFRYDFEVSNKEIDDLENLYFELLNILETENKNPIPIDPQEFIDFGFHKKKKIKL